MKRMKKFLVIFVAAIMMVCVVPVTASAAASNNTYEATNAYVLNFWGEYDAPLYEHVGPYRPKVTYMHANESEAWRISIMSLYNTYDPNNPIGVYCADNWTSLQQNTFYQRLNLEDADFYSEEEAGLMRSIVLNGFPHKSVAEIAEACHIEGLTQGEAITATQLAIWKAGYGDLYIINDYFYDVFTKWTEANCRNYASYYEEVGNQYASKKNEAIIEEHIKAVYDYLINLNPTAPLEIAVSNNSFVEWSSSSVLKDNTDGTYDVSVTATVDVVENPGDALKLSAVLGEYSTTVELNDGKQTVDLVIRNVPATYIYDTVTIAIDGYQTVSDVFLFTVEGGRETAQALTAYSELQLPVHAAVTAEPERVINFEKLAKVKIDEEENYTYLPLSGITFDLYFVAELDDYVMGNISLPEKIDLGVLGDSQYHYPDYTVTTDAFGKASVSLTKNGLADGVYVIAERNNAAILEPVKPFYIMVPNTNETKDGWDYVINITPKNEVVPGPSVEKDVIAIDNNGASVEAGEPFTWIIRGKIPVDLADAKTYVITDELDYRLSYAKKKYVENDVTVEKDSVVVTVESIVESSNTQSILTEGTDYKLMVSDEIVTVSGGDMVTSGNGVEETIQKLEVKLTAAGMDKVAKIAGEDYEKYEVRVYFDTVLDGDASVGEDIPNDAKLVYISSVGFRYETESDDPYVYTCGINIHKNDAKDGTVLPGAEFKLARAATEDEIKDGLSFSVIVDGEAVQVVYEWFYDKVEMTGDKVDVAVTGEDGNAVIYGLADGEYYLIESKAPATYNLLRYPITVELNEEKSLITENVANSNAFELPETGGIGTTIFKICGAALIVVAVVVLIVKKRKENEEE